METVTWIALAALGVSAIGLVTGGLSLVLHFWESPLSPWRKAELAYYTELASGPPFDETQTRSNGVAVYFHVENTSKNSANNVLVDIKSVGFEPTVFVPHNKFTLAQSHDLERLLIQVDRILPKTDCVILVCGDSRKTPHTDDEWQQVHKSGRYLGKVPEIERISFDDGFAAYAWKKQRAKEVKEFGPNFLKKYTEFDQIPGQALRVIARETIHLDKGKAVHLGEGEIEYVDGSGD